MNDERPAAAPRKRVRMAVQYRVGNETRWRVGHTENMSRSGILLRVDGPIQVASRLELILNVPARVLDTAPSDIRCRCLVRRNTLLPSLGYAAGVEFTQVATDALDVAIERL